MVKLYHPDQPNTVTIAGKSYRIGGDNTYDVPDEHVRAFKQQGFVCAGRYLIDQAKENQPTEPIKLAAQPEPIAMSEPEPKIDTETNLIDQL